MFNLINSQNYIYDEEIIKHNTNLFEKYHFLSK